jgi:hypothetical protein
MGDVIDLDSRRQHAAVNVSLVDSDADMAGWVSRMDDGRVLIVWHDCETGEDQGFLLSPKQAREFGAAVGKAGGSDA